MKNIVCSILLVSLALSEANAADTQNLWTTGKIHAVLGVLMTILVLIFIFLLILERKISRLEKMHLE